MSKKLNTFQWILSIIAIVLSIVAIAKVNKPNQIGEGAKSNTQYVLYLGTSDKDTNQPVFYSEEAKAEAESILLKHFGGYTIQEANGGWVDGDTTYNEYTLVIYLSDTSIDKVHAAADEMLKTFNQSSVLIQANQTVTEFYDGAK